ncbi:hypothetical protein Tco_1245081 [Tanacetum coccineum]
MEKAQTESSLAKPNTNDEMNIELSKEFLMKLRSNAYYGTFDEDVVDHIAKILEMFDLIKIPNINEGDGKIPTWKEFVEIFFCKFYPLSRDGEDEILEEEKDDIEKEDERSQKKRKGNNNILNKAPKSDNQNNEQPSKRVCKAEKFEAINYSLGPNEEYIAIRSCEYNNWERNKDSVSHIY